MKKAVVPLERFFTMVLANPSEQSMNYKIAPQEEKAQNFLEMPRIPCDILSGQGGLVK